MLRFWHIQQHIFARVLCIYSSGSRLFFVQSVQGEKEQMGTRIVGLEDHLMTEKK